jgi:hypothetical protein
MAISPQFVGTPRTTIAGITSATYLLHTIFTAGVNGSVVRHFSVGCIADQQLFAVVMFVSGGITQVHTTIPLVAASIADANDGQAAAAINLLTQDFLAGITPDGHMELGAGELIKVTVVDESGNAPGVGESAMFRIVGADY